MGAICKHKLFFTFMSETSQPSWQNNQQAVNQLYNEVIKPVNGDAEPAEHEGNAETSVTSGISISLMDTGSASLPIKNKGTERLPALESLLHAAEGTPISLLPLFYLRAISDQLWGNAQRRVVCTQKAELGWQTPYWAEIPSECNYRMCVDAVLKLDLLLKWLFGYKAVKLAEGSRVIHSGAVCTLSVSSLFSTVVSLCSDSC